MVIKPSLVIWIQIPSYSKLRLKIFIKTWLSIQISSISMILRLIGLFKDETPGNVITESFHIRAKSYHYVLADKSTKSKHKGVSKKGMGEMAIDTYMPSLEKSLLDNPIDKSLLSEQKIMRAEADPMTL